MIKVLHNKNFLNYCFNKDINKSKLEQVAEVQTDSLDEAFQLTQNIDNCWIQNPQVLVDIELESCRSTSAGDVLLYDEKYFVVEMIGFKEINLN